MTLPSPWALLLYACTKTVKPFLQSLFHPYTSSRKCHFYRTRQAWICSCEHCRLQCPVSSNQLAFHCRQSNGRQSRFTTMYHRRNTSNRKPCMHDNGGYRTSVKATGKFCFPFLFLHRPLSISVAHCAIPSAPFSFSPLHLYASVPMLPSGLHQHVIFVAGAKVIPG